MIHLTEYCPFCNRELNAFKVVTILEIGEEKHAGRVTFGESAEGGVRCRDCEPDTLPRDPERN